MCVSVAIRIHSLHVDDPAGGDAAARHVGGAPRRAKLRSRGRRRGWRALGARGRRLFGIVAATTYERSRDGQCPKKAPHSSAVTTRVPAGRLLSPSVGVNRIA